MDQHPRSVGWAFVLKTVVSLSCRCRGRTVLLVASTGSRPDTAAHRHRPPGSTRRGGTLTSPEASDADAREIP
eukprot:9115556-Pyramimonas_sp.AAC.2